MQASTNLFSEEHQNPWCFSFSIINRYHHPMNPSNFVIAIENNRVNHFSKKLLIRDFPLYSTISQNNAPKLSFSF